MVASKARKKNYWLEAFDMNSKLNLRLDLCASNFIRTHRTSYGNNTKHLLILDPISILYLSYKSAVPIFYCY